MQYQHQWRVILMPKRTPQSEWRDTREEAVEDAIALRLAERDRDEPTRIWWHVLAELEMREAP